MKIKAIILSDKYNQDLDVLLGELRETRITDNELPTVPDIYKDEKGKVDTAAVLGVELINAKGAIEDYLNKEDIDFTKPVEDVMRDINKATGFRYNVYRENDKWYIKVPSKYRNISYTFEILCED